MSLRGAFSKTVCDLLGSGAGDSTLGGAALTVMPLANGSEVFQTVVISVLDVVTLKELAVPTALAVGLDDDAAVTVTRKDRLSALRPVGRQCLFACGSFPCHD
jgi:hypothetical protein